MRRRRTARRVGVSAAILAGCVITACTGSATTATVAAGASGPGTSIAVANPLIGDWVQTYTCQRRVSIFLEKMHMLTPRQRRTLEHAIGSPSAALDILIAKTVRGFAWGPSAATASRLTPTALCKGAGPRTMSLEVSDAVITWGDRREGSASAVYHVKSDHTITISDGNRNIDGIRTFRFRIDGDRLWLWQTERKHEDPWGGTTFEKGAFARSA